MGCATAVHDGNFQPERPRDMTLLPHNVRRFGKMPDMLVEARLTTPIYTKCTNH
jgi:hypothetical protein